MVISSSHIYSKRNLDVVKTNPANKINVKNFSQNGQIQIYQSSYRGSYTSIIRDSLRNAALGRKVLLIQFMKGGVKQGVDNAESLCGNLTWVRSSHSFDQYNSEDIKKSKTIFNTPPTIEGASTAHSIILITPDAQRTMCTYLGASIEFEPKDIDFSVLKESKYLYLEGYLWDSELAKNAFLKAAQIAHQSNTKIILSLSDSFCVDRHRESFLELIDNYVDIVFCNESEVLSLFKKDKLANCQGELSSLCELAVVTLGSNGSLIINKNDIEEILSINKGKVIDTTGAGDIYAGGFIHGLINNYSLKKCGELGSICAGHIITQLGSRSNMDLKELLREN